PSRCWPSTTRPTCPRKSPTRWARRTASTTCRRPPTPPWTCAERGRRHAARTRTGCAAARAAGRGAAGAAAAGRRAARDRIVDGGRAAGGVRAAAAGGRRVRDPDPCLRHSGFLGALRRREFQLAAALVLPLHRGL